MDIIVNGTIVQALPIQQGVSQKTGNQWMRASYIIEHEHGQYTRRMVFDVSNARIQEFNLQVGETVALHVNIDCREYPQGSGKFFNSIEAWKVDRQQALAPAPAPYQQQPQVIYQNQAPAYQQPAPAPAQYAQPQPAPAPFPPQGAPMQAQPLPFPPAQ